MRKFLLGLGTTWVGMITMVVVLTTLIGANGSAGAFFGSLLLWLFALVGGLVLSAPAFLNPPDDNGGLWAFVLPLPLWMFLMMVKLASWIGFYILLGTWMLIFKVWDNRQSNQLPAFSGAARQSGPQPYPASAQYGGSPYPPGPQPAGSYPPGPYQSNSRQPGSYQPGPYPPGPQSGSYPSGPQSGSYPSGPQSGSFPSGPPSTGSYPSGPRSGNAPAGSWQTDPTGRYRHRWWDGTTWTDRVANGTVQAVDPL